MTTSEMIAALMKSTGKPSEECIKALKMSNNDANKALELLGGKQKKEKKLFNVGDIVICVNPKSAKLNQDAIEFLLTYKYFKILDVNENKNIDIGYINNEGKNFYFSPNRFELRDKPKVEKEPVENKSSVQETNPQQEKSQIKTKSDPFGSYWRVQKYTPPESYENSPDDWNSGWK